MGGGEVIETLGQLNVQEMLEEAQAELLLMTMSRDSWIKQCMEARRVAEKYYMYANSGTFPSWQDEGIPWRKDND